MVENLKHNLNCVGDDMMVENGGGNEVNLECIQICMYVGVTGVIREG